MTYKRLVYLIWAIIVLSGPITILMNTPLNLAISDPVLLTNFFQRITGLVAFSMLFCQILLGSYLKSWTKFLGSKPIRLHIIQGLSIYALLLAHPLLYVVFTYQTLNKFTLFLLPNLDINTINYELYLTYGRIAFILLSIGVFVGYFRTKPFLRRHWQKIHILNYFSFFFVGIHAFNVGTDISSPPFSLFFWAALATIAVVVWKRFAYIIKPMFVSQKPAPKTS